MSSFRLLSSADALQVLSAENPQTFHLVYSLFLYKNIVFPAQAEYSYFSADFGLKIFLYYYILL